MLSIDQRRHFESRSRHGAVFPYATFFCWWSSWQLDAWTALLRANGPGRIYYFQAFSLYWFFFWFSTSGGCQFLPGAHLWKIKLRLILVFFFSVRHFIIPVFFLIVWDKLDGLMVLKHPQYSCIRMYDDNCSHFLNLFELTGRKQRTAVETAVGCKLFLFLQRLSLFFCHSWLANVFMHRINLCTAAHAAENFFSPLTSLLEIRRNSKYITFCCITSVGIKLHFVGYDGTSMDREFRMLRVRSGFRFRRNYIEENVLSQNSKRINQLHVLKHLSSLM